MNSDFMKTCTAFLVVNLHENVTNFKTLKDLAS